MVVTVVNIRKYKPCYTLPLPEDVFSDT